MHHIQAGVRQWAPVHRHVNRPPTPFQHRSKKPRLKEVLCGYFISLWLFCVLFVVVLTPLTPGPVPRALLSKLSVHMNLYLFTTEAKLCVVSCPLVQVTFALCSMAILSAADSSAFSANGSSPSAHVPHKWRTDRRHGDLAVIYTAWCLLRCARGGKISNSPVIIITTHIIIDPSECSTAAVVSQDYKQQFISDLYMCKISSPMIVVFHSSFVQSMQLSISSGL